MYIKQGCSVAGNYTIPEIFTHKTETLEASLGGIWVEYDTVSDIGTKVSNMTGQSNKYGFIANTIVVNANNEGTYTTAIQKYIALPHLSNGGGTNVPEGSIITNPTNTNRTILKITNSSKLEPIIANAQYDETDRKIKINVIYSENKITKVIDEQNNIINNNEFAVEEDGEFEYKFIVIDEKDNLKEIKIKVQTTPSAPYNMTQYRNNTGTIYTFLVTGNTSGGTVWGSDIYTDDSNIAMAAVHAGVLKNGETGIVKIEMLAGRSSYTASTRNGVTTKNYTSWPGSYRFVK